MFLIITGIFYFLPQLQQRRLPIKPKIRFVLLFAQWNTITLCTLVFLKKKIKSLLILCVVVGGGMSVPAIFPGHRDRSLWCQHRPFVLPAWWREICRSWHLLTQNKQCANREFPACLPFTEIWITAVVSEIIQCHCGATALLDVFPESNHTSQLTFLFIYCRV